MMTETRDQFFVTRVAYKTGGGAKKQFPISDLQVEFVLEPDKRDHDFWFPLDTELVDTNREEGEILFLDEGFSPATFTRMLNS